MILPIILLPLLTNCKYARWGHSFKYRYSENSIENPVSSLNKIGIVPFTNDRKGQPPVDFTNKLASRIHFLVDGVSTVRPEMLVSQHSKAQNIKTLSQARELLNASNLDGVILGRITRYDPYIPPLLELSLMLVTKKQIHSNFDLNKWMNTARPPVKVQHGSSQVLAAEMFLYDSKRDDLREKIKAFGRAHVQSDTGFESERRWLMMDNFTTFIATDIAHRLFKKNGMLDRATPNRKQSTTHKNANND